jgi:hypothetical protein
MARKENLMEPIRIRVTRVIDYGTIVSIVGIDTNLSKQVVVHVDYRPFQKIWEAWREAGFSQPITFDADRLTLSLAMEPDDEACEQDNDCNELPAA